MSASSSIKAGAAYVELYLKDGKFDKGLKAAESKLTGWGATVAGTGGKLTAIGAAIRAPLQAAAVATGEMGAQLVAMRTKTGLSVEALSALGYAATSSEGDLDSLVGGVEKMNKVVGEAFSHSVEKSLAAREAFHNVGVSLADLKDKTPEQRLEFLAAKLDAIEDPAKKALAATTFFGKGGQDLIPILTNLAAKAAKAKALGLIVSTEDAEDAEKFSTALGDVWAQVKRVTFGLGSAFVGSGSKFLETISKSLKTIIEWVDKNRSLVFSIGAVGAALITTGTAIVGVGAVLAGLGVIAGYVAGGISALGTMLGVAGSAFAFILTPAGAFLALVAGGAVAWATFTQSGQAAVGAMTGLFFRLFDTAKETLGGISSALMSGNLALAGTVAMAGLKVAMLDGVATLSEMLGGEFGKMVGTIGERLISGDLTGAWNAAISGMASVWATFAEGAVAVFTVAARSIISVWQGVQNMLTDTLLKLADSEGIVGTVMKTIVGDPGTKEGKAADKKIHAMRGKVGIEDENNLGNGLADVQANARGTTAASADAMRKPFDALDAAMNAASRKAAQDANHENAKSQGPSAALDQAKRDLDAAIAQAKSTMGGDNAEAAKKKTGKAGDELDAQNGKVQGSFSSAAASRFGRGSNPIDKVAQNTKDQLEEQKKTNKLLGKGGLIAANN